MVKVRSGVSGQQEMCAQAHIMVQQECESCGEWDYVQVVGRAGVGIDNVDLQAATEVGCLVVNAPTANTVAAAEHGIALLSALARNVAQASASMKAGVFPL